MHTTKTRRLTVTVGETGFLVETEWQNRIGYWSCMSRTFTTTFPFHVVDGIVALDRDDYIIVIKAR